MFSSLEFFSFYVFVCCVQRDVRSRQYLRYALHVAQERRGRLGPGLGLFRRPVARLEVPGRDSFGRISTKFASSFGRISTQFAQTCTGRHLSASARRLPRNGCRRKVFILEIWLPLGSTFIASIARLWKKPLQKYLRREYTMDSGCYLQI